MKWKISRMHQPHVTFRAEASCTATYRIETDKAIEFTVSRKTSISQLQRLQIYYHYDTPHCYTGSHHRPHCNQLGKAAFSSRTYSSYTRCGNCKAAANIAGRTD